MANHYNVPNWAGKPPEGLHLDVLKNEKLIQKLMVDEKKCYLFGRNPQLNDFCIDNQSCSRTHSAFVYHRHLSRAFLVDLGSTHGTFIGSVRIEAHKPTQLTIDSSFHFGASTRTYILRERPSGPRPIMEELEKAGDEAEGGLLGVPETEIQLDDLTEFNTAHNRRISVLGIAEDALRPCKKSRKRTITWQEEEEVINPEDVDPSVGRFRNLVYTTLVPCKKQRVDMSGGHQDLKQKAQKPRMSSLYDNLPSAVFDSHSAAAVRLGLSLPNPAPEVPSHAPYVPDPDPGPADGETRKKKYAKEAWPGRKSAPALLL